jgi:regulator of sirC expression with transglutaminase-like and TPR domain
VGPSHWNSRSEVRRRFADFTSREDFDLLEACLLVAAEEYPLLDIPAEVARVDALGAEATRRVSGLTNLFARIDAVGTYLFQELGYRGNAETHDDPRNSYLNEVVNRRTGIPITLSIVYMEVARRAGIETRGVALPGHYVVRVGDASRSTLVDPFHEGHVITEDDCRELVVRSSGRASLFRRETLEGTTPRATLARVLHNLKRIYLAREDYPRAHAAVERLLLISPDDHREIRDRGFLHAHLGRTDAAVADLEAYLSLAPRAPDAEAVRGRLAWLQRKLQQTS